MLYVKKPIVIDAMQWTKDTAMAELIEFTNHLVRLNDVDEKFYVFDKLHDTWVQFYWGDWIIHGLKGEFYPCNNEVFQETYVPHIAGVN